MTGFFLDITDNTGDGFSDDILPVKIIKDIPTQRNLVTLVRSVVRSRDISSNDAPSCRVTPICFQIYNGYGIELCGSEEGDVSHADLLSGNTIQPQTLCSPPISQFSQSNEPVVERDIDGPLSLSNILFREEQDNKFNLVPSLEDPPRSTSISDIDNIATNPSPPGAGSPTTIDTSVVVDNSQLPEELTDRTGVTT